MKGVAIWRTAKFTKKPKIKCHYEKVGVEYINNMSKGIFKAIIRGYIRRILNG